jgi:DNA-binding NarL/FixJ family response regulator
LFGSAQKKELTHGDSDMQTRKFRPAGASTPLELIWTSGDREREVLRLLCDAKTPREIADLLHMSVPTVRGHLKELRRGTGQADNHKLMLFGLRHPKLLQGEAVVLAEHGPGCGCLICCSTPKIAA